MTKNIFVIRDKSGFKAMNKQISNTENTSRIRRSKRRILLFLASSFIFMAAYMPQIEDDQKFTVVLDAGHGGKDPGNLGTGKMKKTEKEMSPLRLVNTSQITIRMSEWFIPARAIRILSYSKEWKLPMRQMPTYSYPFTAIRMIIKQPVVRRLS
jgi:hypothetical protein